MALISCPECHERIASKAEQCPRCGEPDPSRRKRNARRLGRTVGALLVVAGCVVMWYGVIPDLKRGALFPSHANQR